MPRVSLPFIDISNGPSCPEWGVVRKNFGKGQELPGWGADCLTQHQGRKWESGRRGGRKNLRLLWPSCVNAAGRAAGEATSHGEQECGRGSQTGLGLDPSLTNYQLYDLGQVT